MPENKLPQKSNNTKPFSQFSLVTQSCPSLCDSMECSTPGFPVHHELPEFTQTHVHWIEDAIQPPHPLSFPSPPAFNLSQHQGLFKESVLCIRRPNIGVSKPSTCHKSSAKRQVYSKRSLTQEARKHQINNLGSVGKESQLVKSQCGIPRFNPCVTKIPCRSTWLPTPVFLPGEYPWTEEPGGLQFMGLQRVVHNWATKHSIP